MEVGFKSDKGLRRENNEDAFFIMLKDRVYIVADGVGGGNAGEIASRTAVTQIANFVKGNPLKKGEDKYRIARYFKKCLEHANSVIFDLSSKSIQNSGMATTIVIVYITDGKAYISNVGDSRAYLYRGGQMIQLTEDHTYINVLIKAGVLSEEDAKTDERKNVITKALGAEDTIEPDFFQVELKEDDRILICSDGLYDEVSDEDIISVYDSVSGMSAVCKTLVDMANENGGHDNITVISLKVKGEDINE